MIAHARMAATKPRIIQLSQGIAVTFSANHVLRIPPGKTAPPKNAPAKTHERCQLLLLLAHHRTMAKKAAMPAPTMADMLGLPLNATSTLARIPPAASISRTKGMVDVGMV